MATNEYHSQVSPTDDEEGAGSTSDKSDADSEVEPFALAEEKSAALEVASTDTGKVDNDSQEVEDGAGDIFIRGTDGDLSFDDAIETCPSDISVPLQGATFKNFKGLFVQS